MIIQWRKSTQSDDHGHCVELARLPHSIGLRDSKAPEAGHLTLTPAAFADLLTRAKRDRLNP